GQVQVKPRRSRFSLRGPQDVRVSPEDFTIHAEGTGPKKVRVIEQVAPMVTREAMVEMTPSEGELRAQPEQGILKAALTTDEGKIFTCFIKGLGLKKGAIAVSNGWEISGIMAVGAQEEEIAGAVNRVSELGGGIVLSVDGRIQAELPLPIGGLLSNLPIEEVVETMDEIQSSVTGLGFSFEDVFLTLNTLIIPAIPFFRISEDGLVDIKKGELVDLIVS
ncbi:MAG: adenine deaminase C-terminal domain-containing protein, partial [Desulfatiglandales bacterium]|nr:adenine deaminase C-terminal domain-containing protein [Desulfatiglandales bacterium]